MNTYIVIFTHNKFIMCDCDKKKDLPDICSECFTDTDTTTIIIVECNNCHLKNLSPDSYVSCIECDVTWCNDCYNNMEDNMIYGCYGCFTAWCVNCYFTIENIVNCDACCRSFCSKCNEVHMYVKNGLCAECTQAIFNTQRSTLNVLNG
jgi:hypothetical protein